MIFVYLLGTIKILIDLKLLTVHPSINKTDAK